MPDHRIDVEQRVISIELFFDLVFVFAFTHVTALMAGSLPSIPAPAADAPPATADREPGCREV